jgi:hypothetical protein
VLTVGIHDHEDVAPGCIESVDNGGTQTLFPDAAENADGGVAGGKRLRHAPCAIGRIVIHDDDLVRTARKRTVDEVDERRQVLGFVIRRKD